MNKMFSRIRSFLYRHRRKFIVSGIVVGGSILLSRYAQRLLKDWQERQVKELVERTKKQQHYESVERTCNETALTLIPKLNDTIARVLPTQSLIIELKSEGANRVAIFEQLKIIAFAKITILIYMSTMLMVTLRIQLNLIGGYMYKDSNANSRKELNSAIQEKYMSLCQYLFGDGGNKLCGVIEKSVTIVMKSRSLKENLSVSDVEQLFWSIHAALSGTEGDVCKELPQFIIPPDSDSQQQLPVYNTMLVETRDLLESEEIVKLLNSCISRGFAFVMDDVAEYFISSEPSSFNLNADPFFTVPDRRSVDIGTTKKTLAKLIPIINGLINNSKGDLSHKWMRQLILMDNLKVMGANVYETFSLN